MNKFQFIVILLIAIKSFSQEIPPFANITGVEYRGTGCDAESAHVAMTPDLSYLSVLYDRFSVEVGSGTANPTASIAQKNCMIVVKFDLPAGWSLQFDAVEYRGFVSLPNQNTIAQQMISVQTTRIPGRNFEQNLLRGPMQDNFVTVYTNPVLEKVEKADSWPPANFGRNLQRPLRPPQDRRPPITGPGKRRHIRAGDLFECSDRVQQAVLKISSRIAVRNIGDRTHPTVQMVVDSTDASFNQKLKINWNKCSGD